MTDHHHEAAEAHTEAAAPATPAAPSRIEQNGVVRPRDDTDSGKVWLAFEAASDKLGRPVTRKELSENPAMKAINEATFATQYARCVKFHGVAEILKGNRQSMAAEAKKAREEAKKAEKEAAEAKKKEDAEAKAKADAEAKAEAEAKAAEKEAEKQRKADEKKAEKERKEAEKKAAKEAQASAA